MVDISQEHLKSVLCYCSESGSFVWLARDARYKIDKVFNSLYAGKIAGSILTSIRSKTSYIAIKIDGKSYKAHRLAFVYVTGCAPEQVDHIDNNGLNNSWENLRASNSKDNSKNLPIQKSNKTGVIGVNWHKSAKKWQARAVNLEGKRIDLGRFDVFEDAVLARKNHEIKFKYFEHRGGECIR